MVVHVLLALSGGLALVYEVLWLRRFAAVFGATTPATAATLAAVLLGFAAGSAVWGVYASGCRRPLRAYGGLEIAAASILLFEGKGAEAGAVMRAAVVDLPVEVQTAVLGPVK